MSRLVMTAWVVAALCVLGAIGVAIAQPIHWERTVGLALVIAVIAAATALYQSRRGAAR